MAGEWSERRLGDLVALRALAISDGYRVTNEELGPEGIPFVRGGDIGDGWIDTDTVDRIRPELAERVQSKLAGPGDVAFITKGTVGRAGRLRTGQPPVVFAPQVAYWRVLKPDVLDSDFLFYLIRSRAFQAALDGVKTHGSMVADYVSISQQLDFTFKMPDILTQRAIGRVLTTLDDKIELNRRMNETLEAMARALFKSWFVDFDPVHATSDSAADWTPATLGDIADSPRRIVSPGELDGTTPYIGLEHMPRRCIALSDWGAAGGLESQKFRFRAGEILFGKLRPYFHKVGVAPIDGVCSTDIVVLSPRSDEWFGFVLGCVSRVEFIEFTNAGSTGTRMPRTSWPEMARYPIKRPPLSVAGAFTSQVRLIVDRMRSSIHESRTLSALRHALLPKLISGELRVKDAERIVANSV